MGWVNKGDTEYFGAWMKRGCDWTDGHGPVSLAFYTKYVKVRKIRRLRAMCGGSAPSAQPHHPLSMRLFGKKKTANIPQCVLQCLIFIVVVSVMVVCRDCGNDIVREERYRFAAAAQESHSIHIYVHSFILDPHTHTHTHKTKITTPIPTRQTALYSQYTARQTERQVRGCLGMSEFRPSGNCI